MAAAAAAAAVEMAAGVPARLPGGGGRRASSSALGCGEVIARRKFLPAAKALYRTVKRNLESDLEVPKPLE